MKRPSAWPALPALGPETGPQALDWWSLWSSGHLEERSGRKRGRPGEEETERSLIRFHGLYLTILNVLDSLS